MLQLWVRSACVSVVLLAWVSATHGQSTIDNLKMSDYSGDGMVDALDYSIWRSSFGDFNQDHVVDSQDYAVWRSNFGGTGGGSENRFNGSTLGLPVPVDALLGWRSVPLQGLFDTKTGYNAWVNRLTSAAALPGDYNSDGVVDAADYAVWRDSLLAVATVGKFLNATGDTNADGEVDARDYALWRENFGATTNLNTLPPFPAGDFDADGVVDAADYTVWRDNLGGSASFSRGPVISIINESNDWAWFIDPATVHTPSLLGDLNHDGFVGLADLDIILNNWNRPTPPAAFAADPTGDGFVGLADLDIVLNNWNAGTPPIAGAGVPEPAALGVLLAFAPGLLRRSH